MFMWGLGNSREWDTMWTSAEDANTQVTVDDVMGKSHKMITQINHTNESHKAR